MGESEFLDGIAFCQLIPGATAFQMSGYVGYRLRGALGAFVASVSFILPAFVLMVLLSATYLEAGQMPLVHSLFIGLRAIVVAIIAYSAFNLGRSSIKNWQGATIAAVALGAYLAKVNIFLVILASGLTGFLLHPGQTVNEADKNVGINATVKRQRISARLIILWLVGAASLVLVGLTLTPALTRLSVALIKIGSAAFGGGYTMIPLIQSEVVNRYHWLTTQEFIDGIAMGQITPGPIIITATFIGYKVNGLLGAVASTVSIFLPSLLILLFFAPRYEAIKKYSAVRWVLGGILGSFISLLIVTVYSFGMEALVDIRTWGIAMAALVAMFLKVEMAYIILVGMAISVVMFH
jgi:chromate transporter